MPYSYWSLEQERENARQRQRRYVERHPDRVRENQCKSRERNREHRAAYNREYYEHNRDREAQRGREYREHNREHVREYRYRYYESHPLLTGRERNREVAVRYRKRNREYLNHQTRERSRSLAGISAPRKYTRWTATEDVILMQEDITLIELCYMLGRTYGAVAIRRRKLTHQQDRSTQ